MEIKALFAREIVERFHDAAAAERAASEFERVYAQGRRPRRRAARSTSRRQGGVAELAWALKQANLVASTSEARRLVEQGGVEVDGAARRPTRRRGSSPARSTSSASGSKNRRFARIRIAG